MPTSSSLPAHLPSHKKLRQQTLFDSLGSSQLEKPLKVPVSQSNTSEKPAQTDEEKKMWKMVKRRLQSPSFKKTVVEDALLAFDSQKPNKRGSKESREKTPEPSEFIKSSPYFKDKIKPAESSTHLTQYG